MNDAEEVYEIDLLHIIQILLNRLWIIVLSSVLCAACAFSYATWVATPMYQASAMMYVNNSSISLGSASFSISSSDISASQSLVDTYIVILKTRNTLESVIEKANLNYRFEELNGMINASAVNSTEIFRITVTNKDPVEATLIANTIVDVLPDKISSIVSGSSVKTVDYAVVPNHRSSPSITKWALIGALVGFAISCIVIILDDLFDNLVKNSSDLDSFDLPILAVIPDITRSSSNNYNYKNKYEEEKKDEQ